jgi:hypothetical protein
MIAVALSSGDSDVDNDEECDDNEGITSRV